MKAILFSVITLFTATIALAASPDKAENTINWMTWQEAQEAMKEEPRNVFVDVYTNWCGWCKRMDATSMQDPEVIKLLNEKFYAIKFNGESRETINFKGKDFKYVAEGRRGYNELAAALMQGRMSYPTTLYMNEKFEIMLNLPGYQNPNKLEFLLGFFGENRQMNTSQEQFQKEYEAVK